MKRVTQIKRADLLREIKFTDLFRTPRAGFVNAKALQNLIQSYLTENMTVIVPFMGKMDYLPELMGPNNELLTNDINPIVAADNCMEALDFLATIPRQKSSLVINTVPMEIKTDIPYSRYMGTLRQAIDNVTSKGSYVLTIDTNSNGQGFRRGYVTVELLNMHHGSTKYNTLAMVEKKVRSVKY